MISIYSYNILYKNNGNGMSLNSVKGDTIDSQSSKPVHPFIQGGGQ